MFIVNKPKYQNKSSNISLVVFATITIILESSLFFQSSYNGVSKSTLRYRPSVDDDGRYLTCRAENAALKKKPMDDKWTIHVHCK